MQDSADDWVRVAVARFALACAVCASVGVVAEGLGVSVTTRPTLLTAILLCALLGVAAPIDLGSAQGPRTRAGFAVFRALAGWAAMCIGVAVVSSQVAFTETLWRTGAPSLSLASAVDAALAFREGNVLFAMVATFPYPVAVLVRLLHLSATLQILAMVVGGGAFAFAAGGFVFDDYARIVVEPGPLDRRGFSAVLALSVAGEALLLGGVLLGADFLAQFSRRQAHPPAEEGPDDTAQST